MERFNFGTFISELTNIRKDIDMTAASASIRKNIFFRGPNVWILAFSIIVASVGLNVNSTAVIIGAMLISPLMGPIFGVGLGLGVNDPILIKNGFKNLLIMVFISILASTLYFLITPLRLANPTELLARTTPSIYDVMIALFGGAAGILELCRKEKGTVLSGVAIATALMPPLCTAGYGIASGNFQYFIGAIYLFFINGIFIILATYIMVKYLGFDEVKFQDEARGTKVKRIISVVVILVAVPSIWSATIMIRDNKFAQNVAAFVKENKTIGNNYIYDYQSETHKGGKINLFITGGTLSENEKEYLAASAAKYGIKESQLVFNEHSLGNVKDGTSENIVQTIYERADTEIRRQEDRIRTLESELASARQKEIPYAQISKEVVSQYPEIQDLYIANGQEIQKDSLSGRNRILVVANTTEPMERKRIESLEQWLKIRLNDNTVVVMNQTIQ